MPVLPGQTTLLDVRTLAREMADMVGSPFVSDSELTTYVNLGLYALYDLLIQKYGNDYFVCSPPYQFVTDGVNDRFHLPDGSNTYLLPDSSVAPAFYKLLGVDIRLGNTPDSFVSLRPFNMIDRNRFAVPNIQVVYGATNLRYRLNGVNLWLTPRAMNGQTIQVHYIPRLAALINDADVIDGVSGWEEMVAIKAAIKMKNKEESDVSVLEGEEAKMVARIEAAAENRDAGSPMTTGDTLWKNYPYSGGGPGYGGGAIGGGGLY